MSAIDAARDNLSEARRRVIRAENELTAALQARDQAEAELYDAEAREQR